MALYRLISEGSTIFINLRWILLTLDMKESRMYSLNGFMVLITFGICRILPIVPMWFVCLQYPWLPIWTTFNYGYKVMFTVICIILDSLNIYWYTKILILVWKFFSPLFFSTSTISSSDLIQQKRS